MVIDWPILSSALVLGVASGFHCVGMCGPLALSMGFSKKQALRFQLENLSYNIGRVCTYTILGAVVGLVGEGFHLAGFQQFLTIFAGAMLLLLALSSFSRGDLTARIPMLNAVLVKVKVNLGRQLQKAGIGSRFVTGLLNGLLPCGAVYMALTASLAMGSVPGGAAYMSLFGLGTIPLMFLVVAAGNMVSQSLRNAMLKAVPAVMLVLGILFILRGLSLGIPYVSPKTEALEIIHNNSAAHQRGDHTTCH